MRSFIDFLLSLFIAISLLLTTTGTYFTTQNTTIVTLVTTNAICKLIDYAGTVNTSQQYINHWPVMLLFCSGYLQMHRFVFG